MGRLLARILVAMICVLVSSWLIVGWGFHVAKKHQLNEKVARVLEVLIEIRNEMGQAEGPALESKLAELRKRSTISYALLRSVDEAPPHTRARLRADQIGVRFERHQGPAIFVPLSRSGKVVRVGPLGHVFEHSGYPKVTVLAGILLSMLLAGFALSFPIVRRLRRLESAAERIAAGELSARAALTSKDAIGSLARRFDAMASRIEALLSNQRELLQGVSHELRTPAARIRFGLEMLAEEPDAARRGERLGALEEDLDELDRLVDELLLYVRIGDGGSEGDADPQGAKQLIERETFSPEDAIAGLAQRLGELHPKQLISVPEGSLPEIEADPRLFVRALRNLLGNALRYATSRVLVRVEAKGGWVVVSVDDDGPGIPKEERARIFDPFTRLDGSRSRASGGVGLGLAIVRRIVQAHGGSVRVGESDSGGASMQTRWPATKRYAQPTE